VALTIAELRYVFTGDSSGFDKTDKAVKSKLAAMGDAGKKLSSVGASITAKLTLPMVGAGIAVGKMAADFQTNMNHIVGLVGVSQKQVDIWSKQLLSLGGTCRRGRRSWRRRCTTSRPRASLPARRWTS